MDINFRAPHVAASARWRGDATPSTRCNLIHWLIPHWPSNDLVDGAGHCLLADLGLAATRASMRLCGTLEYLAPEQLRGKTYGRSVDLWALGCLTFECLVGYSPFSAARTRAVFEGILRHEPYYVACGDSDAISLVQGLLRKDVESRFCISEDLLAHTYFSSAVSYTHLTLPTILLV